jgi:hypothetical protein
MMKGDIHLEGYCALFRSGPSDVSEVNFPLFSRAARLKAPPLPRCMLNHSRTDKQNGKEGLREEKRQFAI